MKLVFGGATFTVPDGWRGSALFTFIMPAPPAALIDSGGSPANVVVEVLSAERQSAAEHLELRLKGFGGRVQGFQVRERGERDGIAFAVVTFDHATPVVQLIQVRTVGDQVAVVTGTARSKLFDDVRPTFVEVARSFAPG
jgi:hypothetical protein